MYHVDIRRKMHEKIFRNLMVALVVVFCVARCMFPNKLEFSREKHDEIVKIIVSNYSL